MTKRWFIIPPLPYLCILNIVWYIMCARYVRSHEGYKKDHMDVGQLGKLFDIGWINMHQIPTFCNFITFHHPKIWVNKDMAFLQVHPQNGKEWINGTFEKINIFVVLNFDCEDIGFKTDNCFYIVILDIIRLLVSLLGLMDLGYLFNVDLVWLDEAWEHHFIDESYDLR